MSLKIFDQKIQAEINARIEMLNCFALSRIFYLAALLPITKSALQSINSLGGNFLWRNSGKLLRIAREEIINSEIRGGLALLDTEAMCNSLVASQTFRLMKSSDSKSKMHLNFWMHEFFLGIWDCPSDWTTVNNCESEHFLQVADLLSNGKLLENLDFSSWKCFQWI